MFYDHSFFLTQKGLSRLVSHNQSPHSRHHPRWLQPRRWLAPRSPLYTSWWRPEARHSLSQSDSPLRNSPLNWVLAMALVGWQGGRGWGTSADGSNLTSPRVMPTVFQCPRPFQLLPLLIISTILQTGKLRHRVGKNWPKITQVASWRAGIWTQTGVGSRNPASNHVWWAPVSVVLTRLDF